MEVLPVVTPGLRFGNQFMQRDGKVQKKMGGIAGFAEASENRESRRERDKRVAWWES